METEQDDYLTFILGDVLYAIDVCSVREVLDHEHVTKVPRTLDYMKGVLNIRGTVIPVIDLRLLFNVEPSADEEDTSIIVSELHCDDGTDMMFGVVADYVENVIQIGQIIGTSDSNSQETPVSSLNVMNNKFIKGLGKIDKRFVLILDMQKIISFIEKDLDGTNHS
ncbi:MAG: purine-binding chemotaxis protein CheW [Spirochaetaceae bacterium]|nr:purine-binding chemotaxis protein CheW [Spirochaetaceae bacterium]